MTNDLRIRPATEADVPTIAAFQRALAKESEGRELEAETVARGVRALLEHPRRGFYRVAEVDGRAAGSLLVTPEWSDWRDGWFWWVQSVYVRPERRRAGVYRALYGHVQAQARARTDVRGLRLYVERGNEGARGAYEALGMFESPYRLYEAPLEGNGSA